MSTLFLTFDSIPSNMKVEAARHDIFNHAESFSKYIKLKPQARGKVFTTDEHRRKIPMELIAL